MTAQTRSVLYSYFEQGDRPTQSQFADTIDSFVSLTDTTAQVITSDISCGGSLHVSGNVEANSFTIHGSASFSSISTGSISVSGSATMGSLDVTGLVSAARLYIRTSAEIGGLFGNIAGNPTFTASVAFTGQTDFTSIINVPTQVSSDNSTRAASTAFVRTLITGGGGIGAVTDWTPSIEFGGAATGMSYALQQGKYVQIGNLIFADFNITLTAKGSSTGNATLSGFPVSPLANTATSVFVTSYQNMSSISGSTNTNISGTTALLVLGGTTGQTTNITDTNFSDNTIFGGVAVYLTT